MQYNTFRSLFIGRVCQEERTTRTRTRAATRLAESSRLETRYFVTASPLNEFETDQHFTVPAALNKDQTKTSN